ncbi:probable G-protein coupled receptor 139 [Stegostoma tigrinum]|uniref:probable G-protein coupled receptor 139 n=1 Tax=Stegostoma tigrinum TaxID=3053191 RepID=UPI00202B0645|nr:probable G-protein coupled receptor 139 [Stegostoma tigrinum]
MEPFYSIIKIYYTILVIIGVPINLMTILVLSQERCGLSTCTTRYLLSMTTADLLGIITAALLYRGSSYYFPESFLQITPVCRIIFVLLFATSECSVWFTVTFSFDRFVAICCQKLKTRYCTDKNAAVILSTTCILICSKNVASYFRFEPGEIIDNIPWFCKETPSYYSAPGWVAFDWFSKIFTPLLPYVLILLLNTLTVRHILMSSLVRKRLRGQSKGDNHNDPGMESRKKSMLLLFTISGSFILLWLLYVINFLYYTISGLNSENYSEFLSIFAEVAVMLVDLSCCSNAFIYGVTQSKFRERFMSMVKYPVMLLMKSLDKQMN